MTARPTPEDLDALAILAKRDDLTEWEEGFLASLDEAHAWTVKMGHVFDRLWHDKMGG